MDDVGADATAMITPTPPFDNGKDANTRFAKESERAKEKT